MDAVYNLFRPSKKTNSLASIQTDKSIHCSIHCSHKEMDFTELFCDSALAFCQDINSVNELDIDELFSEAFQLQLDKPNPTPSTSGAGAAARAITTRAAILQPHPSFIVPPAPAPVHVHATEQPRPFPSANTRFAAPLSEDIAQKRKNATPQNTQKDTKYCINVWEDWCQHRRDTTSSTIPPLSSFPATNLQFWFILEVRKKNGSEYSPDTLLHIYSGVVRHLRENGHPTLTYSRIWHSQTLEHLWMQR